MSEMDKEAVEKAIQTIPERQLSSLYDIATLYAACDIYDRFTSEYIDWSLSSEALRVMSPEKVSHLFDPEEDNSIIAARVDLSEDQPRLADQPVTIENLTEDMKYETGFMSRNKTSSQTDYSISNHSNGDDIETLAHDTWGNRFLRGRFEVWPFEVADDIVEKSPILQALRTLGNDEAAMDRLEQALHDIATFEETEALVTVQIKLEADGEYLYPGKIPELNKAGVRNRYDHIRDGLSVDDAHGQGVGYVSGEEGVVLGGSGGIRGQYSKLQTGPFPNMQSDDAWLSRPLKEEQAIAVTSFDSIISEFSFTRDGVRLHYLPYPTAAIDTDIFERFYAEVYQPLRDADSTEFIEKLIDIYTTQVQEAQEDDDTNPLSGLVESDDSYDSFTIADKWLRLYGLMYVGGTDPSRVFVDEPNVNLDALTELDDAYTRTLEDVGANKLFGNLASQIDYYLPIGSGLVNAIIYGTLFENLTTGSPDPNDEEDENQHATSDDVLFSLYARVLQGKPVSISSLLREFVSFLEQEQRSNQRESREPVFPIRAVVAQYVILRSLSLVDLFTEETIISEGIAMENMLSSTDGEKYDTREERLQDFVRSHPMLEDSETKSVFLLGGLVGRLTAYQYGENISQKVTEQYPPSSVNRRSLPDITQDVLDRAYTYGDKDDIRSFNRRYTDRLADSMLHKPPSEWALSESEVKWVYALGIAYGKQDTTDGIEYEYSEDDDT